ncbi:hypothetical protein F5B22DRAFT_28671 [Xylaria bambusicola]|uniref:uncharacterized protein n=1 Tax=Xylaria bambusicola TaxID=326684 RepID=UPI00200754EA|nr:uncharacterized protein F5B22DRAFT_28671 [Xylaria bambusicola]KAI0528259.1 hypothetical protein F5B22DRAFT_28671 [Xylaria bambusicola]
MSQLPDGTLGDAVGVLIFTFICLFTNILLLWLYWISHERLGYITLVGYFALLCTISSIIQQIYNYTLWNDLLWAQLYYIKANYKNADVIFNNGNFGFQRVLAIIRLFCYIVESSYLLAYCIQVTAKMFDFGTRRRNKRRFYAVVGRVAPVILAAIAIGLLQTPAVQSSFVVYMVVANTQSVLSSAISIILLALIVRQYIQAKLAWKRVEANDSCGIWSRLRNSNSNTSNSSNNSSGSKEPTTIAPVYSSQGTIFDDNWVVVRLSIAVVLISGFILANVITHLPQADDVARDAKANAPDLSAERARSNIIGYIFGVTPGLAIWIVFGLTRDFRKIMYDTFVPRRWRKKGPIIAPDVGASWESARGRRQADLAGVALDGGLQLDDMGANSKRRAAPDVMVAPLLTSKSTPKLTPSDRSLSGDAQILSIG